MSDFDVIEVDVPEVEVFIEDDEVEIVTELIPGPPGGTGLKGDKGDEGDQGLSAYEVALEAGFEGTREQWLASLVGGEGGGGLAIQEIAFAMNEIWIYQHNLGVRPEVMVLDTEGRPGEPWQVDYPNIHTVMVTHYTPMAGTLVLNF